MAWTGLEGLCSSAALRAASSLGLLERYGPAGAEGRPEAGRPFCIESKRNLYGTTIEMTPPLKEKRRSLEIGGVISIPPTHYQNDRGGGIEMTGVKAFQHVTFRHDKCFSSKRWRPLCGLHLLKLHLFVLGILLRRPYF